MAWPGGAALPARPPMIFFAVAAVWFAVIGVRTSDHRAGNVYHALMMLAMAWMYAAMGGLPLSKSARSDSNPAPMSSMPGMDMRDMAPGMDASSGQPGHAGAEPANWVGLLNWVCTIGFGAAAVFWLYRLVIARQPSRDESHQTVGILCQVAMAVGMAVMFIVML